jgi:hypothetical protein
VALCAAPFSPPSSAARARITGMGPRGETDAMVAHTPVPESAGSRLSSYPATCALQPAADVGRLSAWQSGLGGARSIVYHSPCTRCVASLRCPPPVTPLLDLRRLLVRPATCDLQPATLTGFAYAGRSGVGSSPSSVPLPRMMFACDALRPPPSPAAPLTPPPSPTAPPNPPPCLGRLRCLLFMAVLSVHRRLAPLVRSRRG